MKNKRQFNIYTYIIISISSLFFFISCSNKLETPETVKGINLGMPYENEINEGINNGLIYDEISKSYTYIIKSDEYGEIKCFLNYLVAFDNEGEKIIKWVELTFNDQFNFISIENENTKSINQRELDYLLNSYHDKYGKGEEKVYDLEGPFHMITWIKDDLKIELSYLKTIDAIGFPVEYKNFFEKGYSLSVIYNYTDEIMEELKKNKPDHKKSDNKNI
jgi:hypothetical protein